MTKPKSKSVAVSWQGVVSSAVLVAAAVVFSSLGQTELARVALTAAIAGAVLPSITRRVTSDSGSQDGAQ